MSRELIERARNRLVDTLEPQPNEYRPTPCDYHVDWHDSVLPLKKYCTELADALEKEIALREKAETVCELVEHWDEEVDCAPTHIGEAVKAWRSAKTETKG